MKTIFFPILFLSLFLGSCATGYQAIMPEQINYLNNVNEDDINFSFSYEVLTHKHNKNFRKKELKKNIQLVAIKITNNTKEPLVFNDDLKLYSKDSPIPIVAPLIVGDELKQNTGKYFLYMLLAPVRLNVTKTNGRGIEQSSFPVGLIAGPVFSLATFGKANGGNNKFKQELVKYNPIGKTIQPNSTLTGLIGINGQNPIPLNLKKIK